MTQSVQLQNWKFLGLVVLKLEAHTGRTNRWTCNPYGLQLVVICILQYRKCGSYSNKYPENIINSNTENYTNVT